MGSASTHLAGRFGGFGRPLRAGDVLDVNAAQASGLSRPLQHLYTQFTGTGAIRVTRGPQWEWFEFSEREQFLSCRYVVGEQSDRTGLRLGGPAVRPVEARQLLTEGVALGAIQVTSDGQPIILFVDQQTTGGYPKIANVAAVDLHRIGQLRPRDQVRFELISFEQAIALLREREAAIAEGIRA
jgi:antagonist of KipI